jgi:hypothetical protein
MTYKNNRSLFFIIFFIITAFSIVALMEVNFYIYFIFFVICLLLLKATAHLISQKFQLKIDSSYVLLPYSFFNLLGLINAISYYMAYGNYFGAYADDSKYFFRAMDISQGIFIGPTSIYEHIISMLIKGLGFVSIDIRNYVVYLMPINIFFISISIGIISQIYMYFRQEKMPFKHLVVILCLNSIVITSSVHLYRDALVILLFYLTIISHLKKKTILSWMFFILTFSLRGAFAVLLLFYKMLDYFIINRKFNKKIILAGTVVGLLFCQLVFDYIVPYVSFFKNNTLYAYSSSVLDARTSIRAENLGAAKGFLFSIPILRPLIFFMSPISFVNFSGIAEITQNINTWEAISFNTDITNFLAPFSWFTTLMLPYIIPILLIGIYNLFLSKDREKQSFSLFFIFSWIAISIFSMQVRHLTVLILLYPILFGYGKEYIDNKNKTIVFGIQTILYGFIILTNILG